MTGKWIKKRQLKTNMFGLSNNLQFKHSTLESWGWRVFIALKKTVEKKRTIVCVWSFETVCVVNCIWTTAAAFWSDEWVTWAIYNQNILGDAARCSKVWRIQGTKELPKTWDCPATKCHICPTVNPQICSLCDADILYQSVACIMKQILFDQHYPYFETARRHVLWYLIAILTRVDFSSLQLWSPLKRLLTQTASKTIGLCQLYDNNS